MGRGEYDRWDTKISTDDLLCVRLADFKKHKCFTPGRSYSWQWTNNGEKVSEIGFTVADSFIRFYYAIRDRGNNPINVDKTIPLTTTPCNYGGHRKWFLCGCGRKVATMFIYHQKIACRNCFDAVYPSQREDAIFRLQRKIYKLEDKMEYYSANRKGVHKKTIDRISNECLRLNIEKEELFDFESSRRDKILESQLMNIDKRHRNH